MIRLRHLLAPSPSPAEVCHLHDQSEVTFAPMDALLDGLGGLDISLTKPFGEVRSGSYNYFADGDVLLAKVTPCFENGKKALAQKLSNGVGFATSEVHVFRADPRRLDSQFLIYLLSSEDFRADGMRSMTGAGGLRRVNEKAILDYRPRIKDLPTQKRIAAFLDRETARIDELIAKKERLVNLLDLKLRSAITNAVTKGIQNGINTRDSGIEWIGEIPAHWDLTKLGSLGRCANGINIGGDAFGSGYPFISYGDVYKNRVLPSVASGLVQSSANDRKSYTVQEGDVFFTRTSETIEEVGFSSVCMETIEEAVFAGFLIRFRPRKGQLHPLFSKYAFQHSGLRDYFAKEMNLITRASLS